MFEILGCVLCVFGSATIVLHAPQEREINSVMEVWNLATEPGTYDPERFFSCYKSCRRMASCFFDCYTICICNNPIIFPMAAFLLYTTLVVAAVFIIIIHYIPKYGQTHIIAYIGVCSLTGSIAVSCRICVCQKRKRSLLFVIWTRYFFFLAYFLIYISVLKDMKFIYIGHVCQSTWNSIEVNFLWNKSTFISSNMGIWCNCYNLCANPIELLEHGKLAFTSAF